MKTYALVYMWPFSNNSRRSNGHRSPPAVEKSTPSVLAWMVVLLIKADSASFTLCASSKDELLDCYCILLWPAAILALTSSLQLFVLAALARMQRNQLGKELWGASLQFLFVEVEEGRHRSAAGKADVLFPQLVKERVAARLNRSEAQMRGVLQQAGYQVHSISGHAFMEDLAPGVSLDLRELELGVVGVHRVDLLASWCAEHLNDLY
mmetsp:Transcript_29347/g.64126  ORF Transcript_29347/g.64126 Transcript_29347/m.64126 type:complete len:208 (+) Transcript_29347:247-870(+)